ncbi:unnamed protein product [Linum trigynum]|uniref:Uncharacterized protein n=1 Tax=Linum trigynum TaxID=586398 RepID=A0AAV2D530_9ROSI
MNWWVCRQKRTPVDGKMKGGWEGTGFVKNERIKQKGKATKLQIDPVTYCEHSGRAFPWLPVPSDLPA